MTDLSHVDDLLSAYMDGELDAAMRARVEAHLQACARCGQELETWRGLHARLRDAAVPDPGAAYWSRFATRVHERLAGAASSRTPWVERLAGWFAPSERIAWGRVAGDGFERVRLGVLPLGTVNVFDRELGLPQKLEAAWGIIRNGKDRPIDLPKVEYGAEGNRQRRHFVQLGGAGLDARAIELVNWELKRRTGPLAYVWAGCMALDTPPEITTDGGASRATGGLVLIGNGRLYGGSYRVFPKADLHDGLLDVCVFPKVNWWTLTRCGPPLLLNGKLPAGVVKNFQAEQLTLSSKTPVPLEVDGELIGQLPATFSVEKGRLRVAVG